MQRKKALKKQPSALSHLKGPEGPRLRFILDTGTLSGDWLLVWRRTRNRKDPARLYLFFFPGGTAKSALDIKVSAVSLLRLRGYQPTFFSPGNQDGFFGDEPLCFHCLCVKYECKYMVIFPLANFFLPLSQKKRRSLNIILQNAAFCILPRLQNSDSTLDIFLIFQHIICKTSKFSEHLAKFCFLTPAEKKVTFQKKFFSPATEIAASRWFPHS